MYVLVRTAQNGYRSRFLSCNDNYTWNSKLQDYFIKEMYIFISICQVPKFISIIQFSKLCMSSCTIMEGIIYTTGCSLRFFSVRSVFSYIKCMIFTFIFLFAALLLCRRIVFQYTFLHIEKNVFSCSEHEDYLICVIKFALALIVIL